MAGDAQFPHVVPEGRGDGISCVHLIEPGESLASFGCEEVFSLVDANASCGDHVELPCYCAVSGGFCWDLVWWEVAQQLTLFLEECQGGGSQFALIIEAPGDGGRGDLEVVHH